METIAALAAKKAKLEADLSEVNAEIAARAGQTDADAKPKPEPKPMPKGKGK